MVAMGRKGGPRDRRPVDPMTGRFLNSDILANASKSIEDGVGATTQ